MSSFGSALSDIGGAVSDLFGSSGDTASAASYTDAATIAGQNAAIAKSSAALTQTQLSRQIYQTIGTQVAQVGGAGFKESGSALSLLASSASQGAISKSVAEDQGLITENSYAEQQGIFTGMANAAKSAGTASSIGGDIEAVGAAGNLINAAAPGAVGDAVSGLGTVLGVGGAATATSAVAGSAAALAAGSDTVAAAGLAADGVTDAAAAAGTAAATGGGIGGLLSTVGAFLAWIICTELVRQGRLQRRWYLTGARVFASYPEVVKEGYYVWAIPSVRHLRRHPRSLYSRFLCAIFNWRAENIAAYADVRGARKLWRGALVTSVLWPACAILGFGARVLGKTSDWKVIYA